MSPEVNETILHYRLVANGDTVYVLGDSLRAYRIPRE